MKVHRISCTCLLLVFIGLTGLQPMPAHAGTITVNSAGDEQDNSCADGDCSLRDAIQVAASGDIIVFAPALSGQTITLSLGQLNIGKGLTIDGSGLASRVKISGGGAFRVFLTFSNAMVTLRALDIRSGYINDGNGGSGIYNQRFLTVSDCVISANSTPNNGGGIRNTGTLLVTDSIVAGNSAGYGGGIRNEGDLTITDSSVRNNTADFGGGIDNYVGSMVMRNTLLEHNDAKHYGGGLTTGTAALVEDSIFSENSAESGGGIESHEAGADLTLTRCTFTGNTAHLPAGYGGALNNNEATVEVNDSAFEENAADMSGAGIYNDWAGILTVNDSSFVGNTASSGSEGHGGAIGNDGTLALNRSMLSGNTAFTDGGGIFNHNDGTVELTDTILESNAASGEGTGWGGGIFNRGELAVSGGRLTDNTAHLHAGGIWNWEGELTVTGVAFEANSAGSTGGAIVNNWYSAMTVTDCTFHGNSAEAGGGIFNDNWSNAEVNSSTFEANSATVTTGGGIENRQGTLTATNCTFSGNTSASAGGGADNTEGSLTLTHCTLWGNSAAAVGGGVYNGTRGTLHYRNTIIAGSPSGGDCVSDGTIGDNVNTWVEDGYCDAWFMDDPGLEPLADNGGPTATHALLPDSPAIDAGDDTACTPTDQRGATRPADGDADSAAGCDIGAVELGGLQCGIRAATEPADYLFLGDVNVRVTDDDAHLDCLRITDIPTDHPHAAAPLQTGTYWQILALTGDHSAEAAGYTVDLTLPDDAANEDSRVCRWTGSAWDCATTGYDANTVTRADITELSDWTVGSGDCGEAVMPDPGISLAGAHKRDVLLSWTDDPANAGGYQVHRSKSPYFTPSAGTLRATRPAGATSYTDMGAAGTAGVHYSYIVRGLSNCGAPSDYDRRLGVFNFGLVPGQ